MLDKQIAQKVLTAALSTGGDFAEIFLEDNKKHHLQMKGGDVETAQRARIHGAGIRVFYHFDSVYVYTNDTSYEGLLQCAKRAAAAIVNKEKNILQSDSLMTLPFETLHPILLYPETIEGKRKVEKMRATHSAAMETKEISQVIVNYLDSRQDICVANSKGLYVTDTRVRTRLVCSAVASNEKENQTGFADKGSMMGFEMFDDIADPQQIGREAARIAKEMLYAPDCPAGVMPVVIDNGFGGVIFHEACGHSLEATTVAHGLSEFSGKLGQKIAADCVTAIDDGTMKNEWGSENIDDEGRPTQKLTLIENGILKNYMIDELNSRRMNMPPTGNGRRESYAYAPTSRMHNTYIAPGKDDEEEMIRTMGEGLYAKKMGGGSVNPTTGEFNFNVSEGYWVKDGKILHPVRGASLIGTGSQVLLNIDRVGKNMTMAQGMCGSVSGSIPVNVGQPMIRVKAITVGGK
ncbi:MAG: TldD/PmbA family protein [Clostridiales bacterium]|nr:TldD/PmbA family protein [Clostridiales bacterium]